MENDFGCDFSVARYALLKVEYRGVDEATEYIFGDFDQTVMNHPFFGYTSADYEPVDNEQYVYVEKCFVCEQSSDRHEEEHTRRALDMEETKILESFQTFDKLSRRQSTHFQM